MATIDWRRLLAGDDGPELRRGAALAEVTAAETTLNAGFLIRTRHV